MDMGIWMLAVVYVLLAIAFVIEGHKNRPLPPTLGERIEKASDIRKVHPPHLPTGRLSDKITW